MMKLIKAKDAAVIVYGPTLQDWETFYESPMGNDLERFKAMTDSITANRNDANPDDEGEKVYSRDLFLLGRD